MLGHSIYNSVGAEVKAFITQKIGMTTIIDSNGNVQAVTLLAATPNTVSDLKTVEKDGYSAVQLATGNGQPNKPQAKKYEAFKITPKHVKEFRTEGSEDNTAALGTSLKVSEVFAEGDVVKASGISKGKGFAGTIKRHGFHRGRKTHGGRSYRRPGSIGSMYPQKIFKGKKMAGQMGYKRVTISGLKVAFVDDNRSIIAITGAVPGPRRGLVLIRGAYTK